MRRWVPTWSEVALAFNAATLLFALPLYMRIFADPGLGMVARLLVLVQLMPTAAFAIVAAVLRRSLGARVAGVYWSILTAAAVLSLLRLIQLELFSSALVGVVWWQKALIGVGFAIPLIGAIALPRAREGLLALSRQVTPAVILVTLVFVLQFTTSYLSGLGSGPSSPRRDDTVIFVIFDELGRDVLADDGGVDARRFPNLAAVAAEGAWFTDATTNYGVTCAAVPSLLTGRYITELDCMRTALSELEPSILSRLADAYRLSLYEEVLRDCHGSTSRYVCRGVPYFVARYPHIALAAHLIPPTIRTSFVSDALRGSHTPYALVMWDEFIADVGGGDQRGRAYFVHIAIPHSPFIFDETGQLHHSPAEYFTGRPEDEPVTYANYERQARLADRLFGQLVGVLRDRGIYAGATIVVTGDHGPWGPPTASGEISRLTPRVPLIIKSPSLTAGRLGVEYQHIDLAPTLVDLLRLEPLPSTDGRSAFGAETVPREKRFVNADHGANPFRASEFTTYVQRPADPQWRPAR